MYSISIWHPFSFIEPVCLVLHRLWSGTGSQHFPANRFCVLVTNRVFNRLRTIRGRVLLPNFSFLEQPRVGTKRGQVKRGQVKRGRVAGAAI